MSDNNDNPSNSGGADAAPGSAGEEQNPYRVPEAELSKPVATGEFGSIERTLAGEATLDFGNTLSEAWRLTKGVKRILLVGILVMYIAVFAIAIVFGLIFGLATDGMMASMVVNLFAGALAYPLFAGIYMTAVRQSVGLPVSFGTLFSYLGLTGPLIGLGVLVTIGSTIGYMLLVLPGIYLAVSWILALPLMIDKSMGVWEAMETSRKIVTKKWFTVFFLFLVSGLIVGVSALLLIPLIWSIPWINMVLGVVYRDLAGVSTAE